MKKQLKQFIIGIAVGIIAYVIFQSLLEVVFTLIALVIAYFFYQEMVVKKKVNE